MSCKCFSLPEIVQSIFFFFLQSQAQLNFFQHVNNIQTVGLNSCSKTHDVAYNVLLLGNTSKKRQSQLWFQCDFKYSILLWIQYFCELFAWLRKNLLYVNILVSLIHGVSHIQCHHPSEINLICWFVAKKPFLIIINAWNSGLIFSRILWLIESWMNIAFIAFIKFIANTLTLFLISFVNIKVLTTMN